MKPSAALETRSTQPNRQVAPPRCGMFAVFYCWNATGSASNNSETVGDERLVSNSSFVDGDAVAYEDLIEAFKTGDVIYGLRDHLLPAAGLVGQPRQVRKRLFPLFGRKVSKATGLIQGDITDAVWDKDRPKRYSSDKEIKRALVDKYLGINFREYLRRHPKYDVASHYEDGIFDPKDTQYALRAAWGRTSKGSLDYHLKRGATIHFIVTEIALDEVASKNGTGSKGFVTAQELRWLYRNRHSDAVKQRVKFYTESTQVDAESFLSQPIWDKYSSRQKLPQTSTNEGMSASGSNADPQYFKKLISGSSQRPSNSRDSVSTVSTMKFR